MGRKKGVKNKSIADLIKILHEADPKCVYDVKYYNKHPGEFWKRLKEEYHSAINLSYVLGYNKSWMYSTFKKYGICGKVINYKQLAVKMGWKTFTLGLHDIYQILSASKIATLIEGYTGVPVSKDSLTKILRNAGYTLRPRGGANGPKRVVTDKYMQKIEAVKDYKLMTCRQILDATKLTYTQFRYCVKMCGFKYKKQRRRKTTSKHKSNLVVKRLKPLTASTLWG
jgi:transposase